MTAVDPVAEALDHANRFAAEAGELAQQMAAEELARVAPALAELEAVDLAEHELRSRSPYTKPAIAVQDAGHAASPPGRSRRRP